MAVVRITATQRWFLRASDALEGLPRGKRELARAALRPGLTAELGADEIRTLASLWPQDTYVAKALAELEASEKRERDRPSARDIALGRVRRG